jgi:hypothetical protein
MRNTKSYPNKFRRAPSSGLHRDEYRGQGLLDGGKKESA